MSSSLRRSMSYFLFLFFPFNDLKTTSMQEIYAFRSKKVPAIKNKYNLKLQGGHKSQSFSWDVQFNTHVVPCCKLLLRILERYRTRSHACLACFVFEKNQRQNQHFVGSARIAGLWFCKMMTQYAKRLGPRWLIS